MVAGDQQKRSSGPLMGGKGQQPKIVALPLCYSELIEPIRARVIAINAPHQILEAHMQLTPGYLGKVLGLSRVKKIGFDSMWRILEGIGYRIALVEHLDLDAAVDEVENYRARKIIGVPPGQKIRKPMTPELLHAVAQHYGAMAKGMQKVFCIPPNQLTALRRKAAKIRWAKHYARRGATNAETLKGA